MTQIYFAVPGHYTIGDRFDTFAFAEAAAQAKIKPLGAAAWNGGVEEYSRAFVDCRIEDASGDRVLHRVEILPA